MRGVRKDSNKGITSYKTKGRARGRPKATTLARLCPNHNHHVPTGFSRIFPGPYNYKVGRYRTGSR